MACYAASSLLITRQLNANLFILCCLNLGSASRKMFMFMSHTLQASFLKYIHESLDVCCLHSRIDRTGTCAVEQSSGDD